MARDFHVLTTKSLKARLGRSCGRSLNCLLPDSFPLVILNSFQTPTRHDCLNCTLPIVFFVSSHLSSLLKRWLETPHPLNNPCNNYFGISCFTMVTVTHSITISIMMALVSFNLINFFFSTLIYCALGIDLCYTLQHVSSTKGELKPGCDLISSSSYFRTTPPH